MSQTLMFATFQLPPCNPVGWYSNLATKGQPNHWSWQMSIQPPSDSYLPPKESSGFGGFVRWKQNPQNNNKNTPILGGDFLSMRLFVVNWIINILVVVSCFGCLHKKWRTTFCTSETLLPKISAIKNSFFTSLRRSGKMSETMLQTRLAMLEISGKPQAKPSTYGLVGGFNPSETY